MKYKYCHSPARYVTVQDLSYTYQRKVQMEILSQSNYDATDTIEYEYYDGLTTVRYTEKILGHINLFITCIQFLGITEFLVNLPKVK